MRLLTMLADLQQLQTLLNQLMKQAPAAAQSRQQAREDYAALIERTDQLEAENDTLRQQLDSLRKQQQEQGPAQANMRQEVERLGHQLAQLALQNRSLIEERDTLLRKNEDARHKVEEIIARLSALPSAHQAPAATPEAALAQPAPSAPDTPESAS